MEELLQEARKCVQQSQDLASLMPDDFGSRKSEILTMHQGILDRIYQILLISPTASS